MKITCKVKMLCRGIAGVMLLMFASLPVSAEDVVSITPDAINSSTSSEALAAASLYRAYTTNATNAVDVVMPDSVYAKYDASGNPISTGANKHHMVQGTKEASPSLAMTLLLAVLISLVQLSRRH